MALEGAEGTSALGVELKQVKEKVTKPLRRRDEGTKAFEIVVSELGGFVSIEV